MAWHEPATGICRHLDLPVRASAAVPRAGGGLLAATEHGLAAVNPDAGTVEIVHPHELEPGFRTNDGKVDLVGHFWWSTMDDNGGERPGEVFRTRPDGITERMLGGVHIPNTISVSHDGRRLYLADSRRQTIFSHRIDDLGDVAEFAHTRGEAGTPDGSAVDADGYLWNAQWGGWRIVRYAPDGRIDRVVEMPVEQSTSCAFGGPELSTLYITSAWEGLSSKDREGQPLAGGLFAFEPGVAGLALPLFQG